MPSRFKYEGIAKQIDTIEDILGEAVTRVDEPTDGSPPHLLLKNKQCLLKGDWFAWTENEWWIERRFPVTNLSRAISRRIFNIDHNIRRLGIIRNCNSFEDAGVQLGTSAATIRNLYRRWVDTHRSNADSQTGRYVPPLSDYNGTVFSHAIEFSERIIEGLTAEKNELLRQCKP